jgi:peptide/nickel transport system substrate-binding protein
VAKGDEMLRVAIYVDPGTIEPGTTTGEHSAQLMYPTQLTLVTYREDRGSGTGRRIIPYGAQMPTLSDDGKTYTFRIRRGLQFSDGSPVRASNFRAGFERVLDPRMQGQWGMLFENVVGAPAFMRGRAQDVSGVQAPTKDRLVFRLAKAEPDFLSRLAMSIVSAMPLDLPIVRGGVEAPLPSAGPYYVEEYVPGRMVRLVRNPYWKPSTLRTRPAHFREIQYLERESAEAAVTAVRNGQADLATVLDTRDLNPDLIRGLVHEYRVNHRQLWVRPRTRLHSLVFNTRHQPFDDARLRLAVSFALNRRQLLDTLGPHAGHVTDQLLPPISAGFRDWKLYPSPPDLKSARRLARGAPQGKDLVLIVESIGSGPAVGDVIRSNLLRIGLHVKVVPIAPNIFRNYLRNPNNPWDLATMNRISGRVDPMAFINFGLEGPRYDTVPHPWVCPCFYNYSGFDDPKWVKRMRRTDSLRHGRLKAYAWLDHDLMQKAAPIAPYATGNSLTLVSPRIGCFTSSAYPGYLSPNLAALCPRS